MYLVHSSANQCNTTIALGPYIAVLKTHIDILTDFNPLTTPQSLQTLAERHNFLLFEDRKFIDIGNTVQKQYHGGALRISEWAHIVNLSILPGGGIIKSFQEVINAPDFAYGGERAVLILAEMTSKGSLATGRYTDESVRLAREYSDTIIGFVATKSLGHLEIEGKKEGEDFLVFTTGVNQRSEGDSLGQQYQTPTSAMEGGSDFLISGRGIYKAEDPVVAAKSYRDEAWGAYLKRVGGKE